MNNGPPVPNFELPGVVGVVGVDGVFGDCGNELKNVGFLDYNQKFYSTQW